jgi:hypothetical protein
MTKALSPIAAPIGRIGIMGLVFDEEEVEEEEDEAGKAGLLKGRRGDWRSALRASWNGSDMI